MYPDTSCRTRRRSSPAGPGSWAPLRPVETASSVVDEIRVGWGRRRSIDRLDRVHAATPRAGRCGLRRAHAGNASRPVLRTARKVVGVGSVGTRARILLMDSGDGVEPLFLQAKEAQPSVPAEYCGRSAYTNQGERVVAGQHLMQAESDILLGWTRVRGPDRDFYVRQLKDWKFSALRVDPGRRSRQHSSCPPCDRVRLTGPVDTRRRSTRPLASEQDQLSAAARVRPRSAGWSNGTHGGAVVDIRRSA
jgi:hypothetical protein